MVFKKGKETFLLEIKNGTESNLYLGAAMGFGVFMGIFPVWGFQMLIALMVAHVAKLNKPLVLLFANISIPPFMPFILLGSLQTGSLFLNGDWLSVSIESITLDLCYEFLFSYLVGSVLLATFMGALCFFIAFFLLRLVR